MAFKCLLEHTYIYTHIFIIVNINGIFFPQDWEHEQKKWSPMSSVVMRVLGDHRGSSGIIGFWDCWITIIIDSIAPDIVVNDGKWMYIRVNITQASLPFGCPKNGGKPMDMAGKTNLAGGFNPSQKSSVGMMTFPIYGKIQFMFQITNQM